MSNELVKVKVLSTDLIEVKVYLDKKVYQALEYYVRLTIHWAGNEHKDQAISGYVAHIAEKWLEMEAANPQDALEAIKDELQVLLE